MKKEAWEDLQAVLDALPVPVFYKDRDGTYRGCNAAFERFLGRGRAEIVGAPVEGVSPTALANTYRAADLALFASRSTQVYEARVRAGDGTQRDVVFSKGVFFDDAGEVAGLAGTLLDVTERKREEAELRRREQHLEFQDRLVSLGTLAAGIGHEINNPLGCLLSSLQFAQEELAGTIPAAVMAALEDAVSAARRIAEVVHDIRTLARKEHVLRPVDLSATLRTATNLSRPHIVGRGSLIVNLTEGIEVQATEAGLTQVFLNLLLNAGQALPERGADLNQVRVATWRENGRALAEVRDNGVGIPPEIRGKIFDPFFTTKPVGEGTGLGLSICQVIVSGFGGSIEVETEAGQGTIFRVALPAA